MEEQLYYDIYQYLNNFIIPDEYNEKQQNRVIQTAKHYYIQNNKLYHKNKDNVQQRVITPKHTETVLFNLHKDMTGAHLGVDTIYEKAKERYYWPKMYEDICIYIESCDNYQWREKTKWKEELILLRVGAPFDKIGIDIKGPLSLTRGVHRWNPFNPSSGHIKNQIIRIRNEQFANNPNGVIRLTRLIGMTGLIR